MMRATACWCSAIDSNEMPCCASVIAKIWPRSSLGRNPVGMTWKSTPVTTSRATDTARVSRG